MSESLPVQGWNGGVAGCPSGRPGRLPGDQALGDIDELGQHRAVIVQIYHVWDIHCVVHVAQLLCPVELRRSCDEQATLHGSTDLRSQIIVLLHKLSMTCSFCCISYVILCISGVASTQASQMGRKNVLRIFVHHSALSISWAQSRRQRSSKAEAWEASQGGPCR